VGRIKAAALLQFGTGRSSPYDQLGSDRDYRVLIKIRRGKKTGLGYGRELKEIALNIKETEGWLSIVISQQPSHRTWKRRRQKKYIRVSTESP
jgi:hypothetical protein